MPLFDYECDKCGHIKEKMVSSDQMSLKNPPVFLCPKCEGIMRRKIGAPNVHFRGKGFPGNDMKRGK